MAPPFFSIVVPTLNREPELRRCIDSVLSQTFQDWELLIVDDGSTDSTAKLISSYQEINKRIIFISRPNQRRQGGNTCRNIGIENAEGKYISFLDSDDAFGSDRLKYLFDFICRNRDFQAFYSGALKVFNLEKYVSCASKQIQNTDSLFDFIFSENSFVQTSTFVVSSNLAKKVRFDENLKRHQDYDFFIRIGLHSKWKFVNHSNVYLFQSDLGKQKIDFNSCMIFYDKHKHLSLDSNIRRKYLTYISESCAKLNPSKSVIRYYNQQFLEENWERSIRQNIIFIFPYLFHYIYRLKLYFNL